MENNIYFKTKHFSIYTMLLGKEFMHFTGWCYLKQTDFETWYQHLGTLSKVAVKHKQQDKNLNLPSVLNEPK